MRKNPRGRLSTKIQVISRRSNSARLNSWKGGRDPGYDQSGQRFQEDGDLFKGNWGLTIAKNFSKLCRKNSAEQVKDDGNGNMDKQIRSWAFSKYVNVAGVFSVPSCFSWQGSGWLLGKMFVPFSALPTSFCAQQTETVIDPLFWNALPVFFVLFIYH